MQIVINIDAAFGRKVFAGAALLLGAAVLIPAIARAAVPNTFTSGTTISASQMNANFAALDARITALETLLANVTKNGNTVVFTGVNVQIKNGSTGTATTDGTGNLILGFNEAAITTAARTGSHNLVVGAEHGWSSHSGIVSGLQNTVSGASALCIGGTLNATAGDFSAIVGGSTNSIMNGGTSGQMGQFATIFGSFTTTTGAGDWEARYAERLQNQAGVGFGAFNFESDFGDHCFLAQLGQNPDGAGSLYGGGSVIVNIGVGSSKMLLGGNCPAIQIGRIGAFLPPNNGISIGENQTNIIEIGKTSTSTIQVGVGGTGGTFPVPLNSTVKLGP